MKHFNLIITPCPPGHALLPTDEEDEYECQCDDDNDERIAACLSEQRGIVLQVCIYDFASS